MQLLIPYLATHGLRPFQRFFPDMLWRIEAQSRTAYLTFDDGPTTEVTPSLLDLLRTYDARATHFLLGAHARQHPDLVQDIVDAGHRIANHTFTHPDPWQTSSEDLRREAERTTTVLEEISGQSVRAFRPPYGHPTGALRRWCAERQQRMVMWDVMPGDYLDTATPDRISRFVCRHVRPGAIIVLHDNPTCEEVTPEALHTILDTLVPRGWSFDAL